VYRQGLNFRIRWFRAGTEQTLRRVPAAVAVEVFIEDRILEGLAGAAAAIDLRRLGPWRRLELVLPEGAWSRLILQANAYLY